MEIKAYIEEHKDRFRDEWFSLLRIPSVSSQSEHKADMVKCAERWKELLLASGATRAEVMQDRSRGTEPPLSRDRDRKSVV